MGLLGLLLVGSYSLGGPIEEEPREAFAPGRAGFSVKFKDWITPYRVTAAFVLPEAEYVFEAVGGDSDDFAIQVAAGELKSRQPRAWRWKAPAEAGLYPLEILNVASGQTIRLNVFVLVPYSDLKGETLKGYRMGRYPGTALKGLSIYEPPEGFIEVTEQNKNTEIAPHFRLSQFLCKQEGGYPNYLVLKERLILKLELILEKVNERGYRTDTLHIMSGYRTPHYNKAIGNVRYSRHVWGGAADIFIDEDPRDDMMDDLNRDGKIDHRDAEVLYKIIDELYGKSFYAPFIGGLGRYEKTAAHGPFVHVDVRGFRARWGR